MIVIFYLVNIALKKKRLLIGDDDECTMENEKNMEDLDYADELDVGNVKKKKKPRRPKKKNVIKAYDRNDSTSTSQAKK